MSVTSRVNEVEERVLHASEGGVFKNTINDSKHRMKGQVVTNSSAVVHTRRKTENVYNTRKHAKIAKNWRRTTIRNKTKMAGDQGRLSTL